MKEKSRDFVSYVWIGSAVVLCLAIAAGGSVLPAQSETDLTEREPTAPPVVSPWLGSGSNDTLYVVDSTIDELYEISTSDGSTTLIGSTAPMSTPAGLAFDGTQLYSIDLSPDTFGGLFTLDLGDGTPTLVGKTGFSGWQGLASDPTDSGQLYAINHADVLHKISRVDGSTTVVATGVGDLISALEFDASGQLWGTEFSLGTLVKINKADGNVTLVANTLVGFQGIDFDSNGTLYAHNSDSDSLYVINTSTGDANLVGPSGTQFVKGLAFIKESPPVPAVSGRRLVVAVLLVLAVSAALLWGRAD